MLAGNRVDFIIVGAQKSGTTSLAAQLAQHPEICFSRVKEPAFFNRTVDWRAGVTEYHRLFEPADGQICGEASTMYTFFPEWRDTHQRIYEYNPGMKVIYVMRHPVDRIVSHYSFRAVRGRERRPPAEAVLHDCTYTDRSRYGTQIEPYFEVFGAKNVLLLIFEEYISDPLQTLERVGRFLAVSTSGFEGVDLTARGRTAGRGVLGDGARAARQSVLGRLVSRLVPPAVRPLVRARLSRRLDQNIEFPAPVKEQLWQGLEDEVSRIEALLGRRVDVWHGG